MDKTSTYELWAQHAAASIVLNIPHDRSQLLRGLGTLPENITTLVVLLELSGQIPQGLLLWNGAGHCEEKEAMRGRLSEMCERYCCVTAGPPPSLSQSGEAQTSSQ